MIQKLLKSQFFQNFSYLIILQVFNMLVNFMIYPIVLKRLGADAVGVMVLGQTIMQYIIIFVSYGFNISVIESLSVNRDDKAISSEIVSAVISIKMAFLTFSALLYWLLMPFFEITQLHLVFFFLAVAYCLEDALVPIWFFQANEKMKQITIIGFLTKVLYFLSVLLLVHQAKDLYLMPIISGVAAIASFFYSLKMMKKAGLFWVKPKWALSKSLIKESSPFFFMQVFSVIKLRSNNVFIYNYNGLVGTATNDLAEKFLLLIKVPLMHLVGFCSRIFPNPKITRNYIK